MKCTVNGASVNEDVPCGKLLMNWLRERGLQGVKHGCETGECGACAVLVDGVPRNSCIMLAAQAEGRDVTTVEHLGTPECLHPLQEQFVEGAAIQCGYCTPGMLLVAQALLQKSPRPTEAEVREAFSGNLCRCTGYVKPVEAVLAAAQKMEGAADHG
ncbi:MAG: (2Fe-2S)-binding protein [Candidatus Xenobia bacterium]